MCIDQIYASRSITWLWDLASGGFQIYKVKSTSHVCWNFKHADLECLDIQISNMFVGADIISDMHLSVRWPACPYVYQHVFPSILLLYVRVSAGLPAMFL